MATKGKELSELGSILSVSANTANIDGSLIVSNSVTIGNSTVNATFTATSINANTVGGNTASDLRNYSDTVAGTAYSNAATYAGTVAGTAYSNATSYADTVAGTAYTNATSFATTAAGTAYSNAATYADNKAANAYSNAIAYSANATNISSGTLTANVLPTSGVTAATYGNSSQIPVITVDATGRITSATTNAVAGVTSFTYTEANNTFAISTGDGSTFAANIGTANATHTGVLKVLDSVANTNTTISAAVSSVKTAYDAAIAANTNAASAYSNAVSYAGTIADTAYTNATSYAATIAGTAYSNGVTYTDNKAANAYSNATTFASNATNISSGTLAEARLPFRMDQNVRTTDNVTFHDAVISGNLTVNGTTVTINATELAVEDNMIYLNEGTQGANANPDLGFAGAYNDGTYRHAGFFRDASDGVWKVYDQYLPEPDASPFIDTGNTSFRIANFQANVVTAASFSGNGASVTSVDAATVGGNTAGTLRSYSDSVAGTAYTNAVSSASSSAATAYSNAISYFTSNYTASDVLTKIKTVDGTGSGLDADTVDGYDASSFALKTDPEFTNDITTSSGQGRFGGWYAGTGYTGAAFEVGISAGEAYALAYNRGTNSYLNMNFAATDFEFDGQSSGYAHINTSFRAPIFYDSGNTSFYVDPASTSRLNLVAGTLMGALSGAPDSTIWCVSGDYQNWGIFYNEDSPDFIEFRSAGSTTSKIGLDSGGIQSSVFYDIASTGYYVDPASTSNLSALNVGGSAVWTSGNDGAGSGLDADLLDGYSEGGFAVSQRGAEVTDNTGMNNNARRNGMYRVNNGVSAAPDSSRYYSLIQYGNENNVVGQLVSDFVTGETYTRGYNSAWSAWRKVWDSVNDGSGSGLDADLLDGLDATTAATASTIVARDSGGDITSRYFFGVHFNQSSSNSENPSIAAFWTNSGSDNYCRKSTPAHVISQLGLATTSNLASYLPLSGGTMTGDLSFASNWLLYSDTDRDASAAVYYPNSKTRAVRFSFANAGTTGTGGNYSGVMHFHPWDGATSSTGDASYQLAFGSSATNGGGVPILGLRKGIDTTWNSWYYLAAYGVNYKTGALYATQLIDSDSTGYYADPGSTSILNALSIGTTTPTDVSLGVNGNIHLATTNYLYMGGNIGAVGGWGTRDWQSGGLRYINCNNLDINNVGYGSSWNFSISTGGIVSSTVQMRAPIFYDSANTSYYVDPASTSVLANLRATSFTNDATGSVRIMFPGGASYASTSSSVAGAIKIRLPVSWSYTMMRFTVKIYEYTTNESFEVNCGGYNYGSYWVNTFAYILANPGSNRNFTVRFGHDGTYCCVYIGETSDSWTYPQVTVTDFEGGYSGYGAADWDDNWAISFETSFGTISATETNSQIGRVSSIFYDYDNTGYYIDPTSTTSLRTVGSWRSDSASWDGEFSGKIQYHSSYWYFQAANGWYFRNSGGSNVTSIDSSGNISTNGSVSCAGVVSAGYVRVTGNRGIMGDYDTDGTASKVIWTIGASWPLANMYGLGYEYGSGYDHHLALRNNGTTYSRFGFAGGMSMSGTATFTGPVNVHAGSYEGLITFGSNSTWQCGIRQHDDGDAELRIWAKNAAGMIFLATGYDGAPASISRPTAGLVVGPSNNVGIGDFSASDPAYNLHVIGSTYCGSLILGGGSYFRPQNWIQMDGSYGIYWPNHYGAHLYPNGGSSYTQLQIDGSKNSYSGMYISHSAVNGMMYDSGGNGGVYREANGRWYWYHHVGNNCMGVGTATTSSSYYMYVGGSIYSTANIVAASDARIKENVITVESALDKVNALRGVYYNRIDDEEKKRKIGVIAQEVEPVIPEVVTHDKENDRFGVDYGNLAGLFIEAFKEQTKIINDLKQKIEELESKLNK